jgi:RNA polymerase sigma factor (sigma-70 family)
MSTSTLQRSDEELMLAYVCDDDQQAFAELFRSYAPSLAGFFARHGKRAADAQDLVQQTFLRLHRARYEYRRGERLRPWLFTIARNAAYDHGRRQQRRPEVYCDLELQAAPAPVQDELLQAERTRIVAAALAALPQKQQDLVNQHWFEDRSWTEIATRQGVAATTLRVRAHRACIQLRGLVCDSDSPAAA